MGRLLAIDYGNKRVGLAISDPMQIIAKPFKTITYSDNKNLLCQIKIIVSNKKITDFGTQELK